MHCIKVETLVHGHKKKKKIMQTKKNNKKSQTKTKTKRKLAKEWHQHTCIIEGYNEAKSRVAMGTS